MNFYVMTLFPEMIENGMRYKYYGPRDHERAPVFGDSKYS